MCEFIFELAYLFTEKLHKLHIALGARDSEVTRVMSLVSLSILSEVGETDTNIVLDS